MGRTLHGGRADGARRPLNLSRSPIEFMAKAVRDGKLVIPIGNKLPLSQAAGAQAAAEKGNIGKVLLLA